MTGVSEKCSFQKTKYSIGQILGDLPMLKLLFPACTTGYNKWVGKASVSTPTNGSLQGTRTEVSSLQQTFGCTHKQQVKESGIHLLIARTRSSPPLHCRGICRYRRTYLSSCGAQSIRGNEEFSTRRLLPTAMSCWLLI